MPPTTADAVVRFWRILDWTDGVFEEFAGWYCGKTSPVHLFWHSFDLALTRFGGKRAPPLPDADPVTREAYTHEVVSFGFWAGDQNIARADLLLVHGARARGVARQPLQPAEARWIELGAGSLAVFEYEDGENRGRAAGGAALLSRERVSGGRDRRRLEPR